jgi:hypothetical protein
MSHPASGLALAALVLATVAVVVPEVDSVASHDARTIAQSQANEIGAALHRALADLGPGTAPALSESTWLVGPGVRPRGSALARAPRYPISGVLCADRIRAGAAWRGPYLARVPIDPWGRAYVVALDASHAPPAIVVVSAGPDGMLDTEAGRGAIAGDDVGIVLLP